ncbi:hypothetical protein GCM10023322_53470 [Rugosimonospora acidiphila]|uniref:DUF4097 domain-containing protein n=1 Tax=Rugosimonospora acidiphila TaxID=556531 RepID=A0ABP9SAJ9_9ACTN
MRRATLALSATAVMLIASGWAVAGCSISTSTDVRSYEVTGDIGSLSVRDPAGKVEVTVGAGPVVVTETARYSNHAPRTSHRTDSATLRLVDDGCPGVSGHCEVDYQVRVPAATSVNINASAGRVALTGLAGDLNITSSAGEIEGTRLTSASTTVHGEVGRVRLRYSAPPTSVTVTADAGEIDIRVPGDGSYSVDARADAGKTTVSVPRDPASTRRISAHSAAGKITIDS